MEANVAEYTPTPEFLYLTLISILKFNVQLLYCILIYIAYFHRAVYLCYYTCPCDKKKVQFQSILNLNDIFVKNILAINIYIN